MVRGVTEGETEGETEKARQRKRDRDREIEPDGESEGEREREKASRAPTHRRLFVPRRLRRHGQLPLRLVRRTDTTARARGLKVAHAGTLAGTHREANQQAHALTSILARTCMLSHATRARAHTDTQAHSRTHAGATASAADAASTAAN